MIVETTNYFPKPGLEAAVLRHRHRGCDLRAAMGLPRGEVMVLFEGSGSAVRWMLRFPDEASWRADLAARMSDPDFTLQRQEMGRLTERFERSVYRITGPDEE